MPDMKTPAGFLFWTLGVLVFGCVIRIGWEIGGRVWGIL